MTDRAIEWLRAEREKAEFRRARLEHSGHLKARKRTDLLIASIIECLEAADELAHETRPHFGDAETTRCRFCTEKLAAYDAARSAHTEG